MGPTRMRVLITPLLSFSVVGPRLDSAPGGGGRWGGGGGGMEGINAPNRLFMKGVGLFPLIVLLSLPAWCF